MMRSLFSGVAGLTSHQTRMDVIGNNIANVNTIGFKKSRVTFQDMLSQTLRTATAPGDGRGGVNPLQVGLGVQLGTIDVNHTEGSTEPTGVQTDLSIRGNGFFVLLDGEQKLFTRAGAFDLDESGWLTSKATGIRVAGWNAVEGALDTNQPLEQIRVPVGQTLPARATTEAVLEGNLDAATEIGETVTTTVEAVDSQGVRHRIIVDFEKTAPNTWTWTAEAESDPGVLVGTGNLTFQADGTYNSVSATQISMPGIAGSDPIVLDLDFSRMAQYGAKSAVAMRSQNGFGAGSLEEVRIDAAGVLTGVFSNGLTRALAQIGMATFSNNGGLLRAGESMFEESRNSGLAQIGAAGTADRGTVTPGTLEMSNVDLSEEFTSMIITQRGFQANSRIITTSDEMLQELVNLKR